MKLDRVIRIGIAAVIALLFVIAIAALLFVTESALNVWDRLVDGLSFHLNDPGDWYVINSYSGYENKVKANLETRIRSMHMEDRFFEVQIPVRRT